MKLQPEEVVEAIARLDHESKQEFAHIFVTKWNWGLSDRLKLCVRGDCWPRTPILKVT